MLAGTFSVQTSGHMELIDITATVASHIGAENFMDGYCFLFNPHTTAGLTINEGADHDVQRDIISGLREIVPLDFNYRHREGNSPSHLMALLTGSSLTLAVTGGHLLLGTWQRIFFCEYDGPRQRTVHWRLNQSPQP